MIKMVSNICNCWNKECVKEGFIKEIMFSSMRSLLKKKRSLLSRSEFSGGKQVKLYKALK